MTHENPYEAPAEAAGDIVPVDPAELSDAIALDDAPPTSASIRTRLCMMMFLQYFVQGCYLPIASVYVQDALGFSSFQLGLFGSALAIGPLFAPFILGQLVDRYFSTEHVLSASHLCGGLVMLALYLSSGFWPVIILGTLYSVLYVPSMMLSNSLAFHHLQRRDREFPIIRLFGTIGFVLPAWLIELWWLAGLEGQELNAARGIAFCFAGVAGLIMGVYSLTLPHTPPNRESRRQFAPLAVVDMLQVRHFAVLVSITFLISIVHKFYFVWNSPFLKDILREGGITGAFEQRISSIGQISEVLVMAGVGLMISRLGFKFTMLIGTLAYLARCLVLATAISIGEPFWLSMGLACFGQALHGLCFGCFLAVAFIFVDKVAPKDIRGSMQNVFGTFVIGLGFLVGGVLAGWVGDIFTTSEGGETIRQSMGIVETIGMVAQPPKDGVVKIRDWPGIWLACGALALLCVLGFAIFFPRGAGKEEATVGKG
ncbi:MAG: MFS transporter [Pirellulaceae bacterium]